VLAPASSFVLVVILIKFKEMSQELKNSQIIWNDQLPLVNPFSFCLPSIASIDVPLTEREGRIHPQVDGIVEGTLRGKASTPIGRGPLDGRRGSGDGRPLVAKCPEKSSRPRTAVG